jgi:hypothetical protein
MALHAILEAESGRHPLIWLLWVMGGFVVAAVLVGFLLQVLD